LNENIEEQSEIIKSKVKKLLFYNPLWKWILTININLGNQTTINKLNINTEGLSQFIKGIKKIL